MRLGLGTAQFGLDYGISNDSGRVPGDEVSRILDFCETAEVSVLDTAPAYGICEQVLGDCLRGRRGFDVITKTLPLRSEVVSTDDIARVVDAFEQSLRTLKLDAVYGLLVHHAPDLAAEGGARLCEALVALKGRGLVKKIGVSVYTAAQLEHSLAILPCDLVQVPINILDRRLVESEWLSRLRRDEVEVHGRSIFLQGLLLMEPDALAPAFNGVRTLLRRYQTFLAERRLSPVEGALAGVTSTQGIDCALVGVTSRSELEEIHAAFRAVSGGDVYDFSEFRCTDVRVIEPSRWPTERREQC